MAKKIKVQLKLQIEAGKATPAPPVGPTLSQHQVNIQEFCTRFNDITKDKMGDIIPCILTVFEDKTFSIELKTPAVSNLIKKNLKIQKGSETPNLKKIGKISSSQVREIAEMKMKDLNTRNIDSAMKIVVGTAKNMGLEVEE